MAHEICEHDSLLLNRQRAWHGLGVVVQEDFTPTQAVSHVGLDWTVSKRPAVFFDADGNPVNTDFELVVRDDINEAFVAVGSGYTPIQNTELAQFAEDICSLSDSPVKIESVGSIRNGRKVWFLLRGMQELGPSHDSVVPYMLVSNSHDGTNALRVTPTTVRVVCSNTLHMVVPQGDFNTSGKLSSPIYTARHTQSVTSRVQDAKRAVECYLQGLEGTANVIRKLDVSVDDAWMAKYFFSAYEKIFGALPKAENGASTRAINSAQNAWAAFEAAINAEITAGYPKTAWTVANGFTNYLQHRVRRGATPEAKAWAAADSNLFGVDSERMVTAMQVALAV
jgi:phage/plasmid-like protein (TIGR03299 family)